jgi:hypothetical protein
MENWIKYFKSNMNLLSDYTLPFINTILNSLNLQYAKNIYNKDKITKTDNKNNNNSFSLINPLLSYESLLSISNSEFSKHLCSIDSLQHFKDYINSIVNLESSIKHISHYHFSIFSSIDTFIDNNLKFLDSLVSFDETPYKVVKQEDATRLLYYYQDIPNSSHLPSSLYSSLESNSITNHPVLLLVYAPINRYHILDLSHERSIVRKFVSAGFDLFLLDWVKNKVKMNLI